MAAIAPTRGRPWLLILLLLAAALLHGATYLGLGMGAAVLWHSITAFYFQQSYAAGLMPAALAALLLLAGLLLVFKRPAFSAVPAFVAMIAMAVMLPRMGTASPLNAYIHPMQLVHWGAVALTLISCIWLFATRRQAAT
jgi:hypothetical protein